MFFNYNSSLFSGINTNNNNNNSFYSSLAELSSIKSGSYRKLLNSYYNKENSTETNSRLGNLINKGNASSKTLTAIKSSSDDLSETAKELYTRGSKVYDKEETAKDSVKKLVSKYNDFLDAAKNGGSDIDRSVSNLKNNVKVYAKSLGNIGISLSYEGKLSIDEEKLGAASVDSIKKVFEGTNSVAFDIGLRAGQIGNTAKNAGSTFYSSTGSLSGDNFSSFNKYL